ncbi:TPA: restriction endonuclease subunit S [Vibrio campbellii]|nr:restriction endonuclease subunit S [Vibrio campbellii]
MTSVKTPLKFSNTSKWTTKTLEELAVLTSGVHLSPTEYSDSGDIPYFTGPSDITNNFNSVTKFTDKKAKTAKAGDIFIVVKGSGVGKTKICELNEVFMGRQLMSLSASPSLSILIKATLDKNRHRLEALAMGNMIPGLSRNDILSIKISIPDDEVEQQKIADFLTSVDTKISQLTEKHHLLKEYKKGVMQQIFSQKIRFKDKDGQAFPDWVVHPLSKLASKITTKNKGRKIKAVLTNSAKHGIISQQDYFEKDIAREDNTDNYCVVNVDDFVYNPRISDLAPVGPIGRNKVEQGIMSPLYTVFRINSDCCLDFYEYFFCSHLWHRYMYSIANFGARHDRMNITSSDFMALPCPSPCVQEQQKIAEFLQSLDSKINAVAEQIEQTKQFKKGLLQQMFV